MFGLWFLKQNGKMFAAAVSLAFRIIPDCAVCAKSFFTSGLGYSCSECSTHARRSAVALVVAGVVTLLLAAALLLRHLGTVVDDATGGETAPSEHSANQKCAVFLHWVTKVLPLTAIKIVVVVWQIVSQFSAIAGGVYPEEYETFLSYLRFANFDIGVFMSYSCYVSADFYDRLLLATVGPVVVLAMLGGANSLAKKRYSSSNSNAVLAVQSKHLSAALFFIFFVYSSVSYTIFQTFLCDPMDDGEVYLQADYSLTCSTRRHKAYVAYASLMIVVYPIGIPALFCWWLVRNRKCLKMSDRETVVHLQPLRIIWGTYRPSRYYYEVVECCRRIALTMASVFLVPNSVNQIAVVLLLAVGFVIISETMSPFEEIVDMRLYRWGNGVVVSSMFIALLMKANESNDKSGILSEFGGVLIFANVAMIVAVLVQSALLAKTWRSSMSAVEEVTLPVRRTTPVSGHVAPVRKGSNEGAL